MIRRLIVPLALLGVFAACSSPPPARSNPQLLREAERAVLQGNWDRAAQQYEAFLAENPFDADRAMIRMQIGKCRLGAGRPEPAIRAFDQALTEQPSGAVRGEILFRRAVAHRMQGDAAKAVDGFRGLSATSTGGVTSDELHYEFALALFRSGDFTGGQKELQLVSPDGPFGPQRASRLGLRGYAVQVGAYGREELAREEALKLNANVRQASTSPVLFWVLVGSFSKYEEAQRELARLQRLGYTDAFILP